MAFGSAAAAQLWLDEKHAARVTRGTAPSHSQSAVFKSDAAARVPAQIPVASAGATLASIGAAGFQLGGASSVVDASVQSAYRLTACFGRLLCRCFITGLASPAQLYRPRQLGWPRHPDGRVLARVGGGSPFGGTAACFVAPWPCTSHQTQCPEEQPRQSRRIRQGSSSRAQNFIWLANRGQSRSLRPCPASCSHTIAGELRCGSSPRASAPHRRIDRRRSRRF